MDIGAGLPNVPNISIPVPRVPSNVKVPKPGKKTETRNPPSSTTTGQPAVSSVKGLSEGGDQVDLNKMTPSALVQYLANKNYMPTSQVDFAGIAARYKDALAGYNAPQLAAQRQQSAEEVNAQTMAAQRQMRAMQGQQGIRGAAAQGGMAQIANQGQKAIAGTERDLLVRNQAVQAQALANFTTFMNSERGQRLAGMLTSADLGQRAAADAEYRSILQQYLGTAQANTANAQNAAGGAGSRPWWMTPQGWFGGLTNISPYGPYKQAYDVAQNNVPGLPSLSDFVSENTSFADPSRVRI